MKALLSILLIVTIASGSIAQDGSSFKEEFNRVERMDYIRVVKFVPGDPIKAKDFVGVIYFHDDHILLKSNSVNIADFRFNITKETSNRVVKGVLIRCWEGHPYGDPQSKVFIQYEQGGDLYFKFGKKKGLGIMYINKSEEEATVPFPLYNTWYAKIIKKT